eukprot:TRINITY_DN13136_c0_g1_i2.p1 TRINITY_DN13136_c0_g1~~TRINITY_DN13136_c0_g1_i2.p1  ORF type:complete len:339 (-),score=67.52 TRINITY_DN13136_c0_g1_i2:107-1033(-)
MPEQFHLEHSNFNSSLTSSLCSLMSSSSLCDCTLICSDGQLSAHKVILAASSSFFSSVFSLHHHQHPLVYLRGVKTGQMQAVLSYAYSGGAQVAQEDLPGFLALAEDLGVEGLVKSETDVEINENVNETNFINQDDFKNMEKEVECNDNVVDEKCENARIDIKKADLSLSAEILEGIQDIRATNDHEILQDQELFQDKMFKEEKDSQGLETIECLGTVNSKRNESNHQEKKKHVLPRSLTNMPKSYLTSDIYPIHCPSCNVGFKTKSHLHHHMKIKRERQCKNCKLFFENCQRLCVHSKGRCKARTRC